MRSFKVALAGIALSFAVGCSGDSPTSPSPASSTPSRIIELIGSLAFGDVPVAQTSERTLTIRNSGNATLTFTGITASGGLTTFCAASPTTGSVAPGGTVTVGFRCTPTTSGAFTGTVSITSDHTAGTNTTTLSGNGVAPPVTVVGVVTDSVTRAALGGVRVSFLTSTVQNVGTATTDGNGYYSVVIPSAVPLSVSYSLDGYVFQSSTVTFTGDTRRDITLTPSSAAAATLEYRVSGVQSASITYSNCTAGTSQQSDAPLPWSFRCTNTIPTNQFVYVSAQNLRSTGCVKVQIYKRGSLYRESESCGAFVIATASGSY